jgi:hypothetical protein
LAQTGLFRARWTEDIHTEWIRNALENNPNLESANLARTRQLMDAAVRECLVTNYQPLITGLSLPDPKDRHVLAAAIKGNAEVIVTMNLKDFPEEILSEFGIFAEHPDDFIMNLIDLNHAAVTRCAKEQRTSLGNPSYAVEQFIEKIRHQGLPNTAAYLDEIRDLI